jgi:hypothetical protein
MTPEESVLLGLHIAYSCARSDIECFAKAVTLASHYGTPSVKPTPLYDLSAPIKDPFEREAVTLATTWLSAVGLLRRHPSYPHLVSIEPERVNWAGLAVHVAALEQTA